MTLKDYLENNKSIAMTVINIGDESYQYDYWNIIKEAIHFLNKNYTVGHILYDNTIHEQPDGSFVLKNNNHPNNVNLTFYFGGSIN